MFNLVLVSIVVIVVVVVVAFVNRSVVINRSKVHDMIISLAERLTGEPVIHAVSISGYYVAEFDGEEWEDTFTPWFNRA